MKLDVIIDDKTHSIEIPADMLSDAEEFFRKMDSDMDRGWQMGPEFIEKPDTRQRCQIAANKLLVSVSAQNALLVQLMAGYILKRLPGIRTVNIDTSGEMLNTELLFDTNTPAAPPLVPSESEARAQVEKDVSAVYKVGKSWRFAVHDRAANRWVESPFTESETEARRQRDQACAILLEKILRGAPERV